MRWRSSSSLPVVVFLVISSFTLLWAGKEFVAPRPENANTYPSKDVHPNEKVTAAVDPYNTPPKSEIFGTNYVQQGILPVLLIITNDSDHPISMTKMQAELVTGSRAKLGALGVDDVMRRVAHVKSSSTNPSGKVGPIPLPGGNKNKKVQQQYDEVSRARFAAMAVEPHSTQSGFVFFDVEDVRNPVQGAHVYLTGVRDGSGNELMYFEIPVIPANAAATGGK